MASTSLRWATVVNQAPGLFGVPSCAHFDAADVNASCNASSARSKDPEIRIIVAMIRPYSSRKTLSSVSRACDMQASVNQFHTKTQRKMQRHKESHLLVPWCLPCAFCVK